MKKRTFKNSLTKQICLVRIRTYRARIIKGHYKQNSENNSQIQLITPQEAGLPIRKAPSPFCLPTAYPAHPIFQRGRFDVRAAGGGTVCTVGGVLCGGGLPVVLALLESGLCGPCGGAERGHAPSPGAAGEFLRL